MNAIQPILDRGAAIPAACFAVGLLVAAGMDLSARRIPNALSFPLMLFGLAYQTRLAGWSGLGRGFLGALVGIGILFVPFAMRALGGGDVKLLGAVGAWLGVSPVLHVALWTAALCGVLVVALLARHGELRRQVFVNLTNTLLFKQVATVEQRPKSQTVPVGAAMAAAGLWVAIAERTFPLA